MRNWDILKKLKNKRKLIIIEPSNNIVESYLIKSDNCSRVSFLAYKEELLESSITEAYFSSYNASLALLYKIGIKSLSHIGTQIMIRDLLNLDEEYAIISELKRARIESQYYVKEEQTNNNAISKCYEIILISQEYNLNIKAKIINLKSKEIDKIRQKIINL